MKRAFTLVEVVVCLAIVVIVAALTAPVFAKVKKNAQITASLSNLHQMHLALALYRLDSDGDGVYGTASQMGLPGMATVWKSKLGLPESVWHSPCGTDPALFSGSPDAFSYMYNPEDSESFSREAILHREEVVLVVDLNCGDPDRPFRARFLNHRGLGVRLGGQLVNRVKPGDPETSAWWY